MRGDHFDRAVQIRGRHQDGQVYFEGSGFLLTGSLVLTAAHVVEDSGVRYEVRGRPADDTPVGAVVSGVVPHAARDLALLTLAEPVADGLAPARLARLPRAWGQIEVHSVGFPDFTEERARPRSHQLDGTIQLASDRVGHQFQIAVHSSDPLPAGAGGSPWQGFSGAGVLTKDEGLLAGVVTSHRPAEGGRALTATDLAALEDPRFLAVLADGGVTVTAHWLPGPVRKVLDRQRVDLDDLPIRSREDRRTRRLSTVYIRQVLTRSADEESDTHEDREQLADVDPELAKALAIREQEAATGGPPRQLREVLDGLLAPATKGHLLVEAGPGAGKSTLLYSCALDYGRDVEASADPAGRAVPLWATASRLAGDGHSLESAIAVATGLDTGDGTLPELPPGAGWLLLVDALDEVPHDQRSRLIHRLADGTRPGRRTPLTVLLTTRPDQDARTELGKAGFSGYALEPFDRPRLEQFVHTWFEDSGRPDLATEFLRQMDATELGELLRTPLLATVTTIVYGNEPDSPLPDNRWALYEQYRAHLLAAKSEQAERLWQDLHTRAGTSARARAAVAYLRRHLTTLVTHLAYAHVVDETDELAPVAERWWRETAVDEQGRRFGAAPPLAGWTGAITDALLVTGLLVRRGRDLQFLHTTFAEHLAAERLVDELPDDFDPDHPRWRAALLTASGVANSPLAYLHRVALVHYGHRSDRGGRRLLDWLQQGPYMHQLLAGELLGARCPADERHYRKLMEVAATRRADAAAQLIQQLGTIRYDVVREQFLTITRDARSPHWSIAMAVLAEHDPGTAAELLSRAAAGPGTTPEHLYRTAVALWDLGGERTEAAVEAMSVVALHPQTSAYDRVASARLLASRGGDRTEVAAQAYRHLLWTTDRYRWREAYTGLAALGSAYVEEAARGMIASLGDDDFSGSWMHWRATARELLALGQPYVDEAAEVLLGLLREGRPRRTSFSEVFEALTVLGQSYVESAVRTVVARVSDPELDDFDRDAVARALVQAGEPYAEQAATAWRAVLLDRAAEPSARISAAVALRTGDRAATDVEDVLRGLVADPGLGTEERDRANALLGEGAVRTSDPDPREYLRILVESESAFVFLRRLRSAPLRAARKDPVAGMVLLLLASVEDAYGGYRMDTRQHRLDRHPVARDLVVEALRDRVTDPAAESRGAALRALLSCDVEVPEGPDTPDLLRSLLLTPAVEEQGFARAVAAVEGLGEAARDRVTGGIRATLGAAGASAEERQSAVRALREFGGNQAESAAAELRAAAAAAEASDEVRMSAVRGLLALGGRYTPTDETALRLVTAHPATGPDERLLAWQVLLGLDRRVAPDAADDLLRLAGGRRRTNSLTRLQAAAAVADLGGRYVDRAARAVRSVARQRATGPHDVEYAAELLLGWGAPYARPAMDLLCTRVFGRRSADAHWTAATRMVTELDAPYAREAARAVRRTASRPLTSTWVRSHAADALVRLGDVPAAARILCGLISRCCLDSKRAEAASILARFGDAYADQALDAFRAGARRRRGNWRVQHELDWAEALAARGGPHRAEAADVLRGVVERRRVRDDLREKAARRLHDVTR
ncbi:trypsin-like peptidase domain-containing protein [Streptomyces longispororuber]|uniref:trypsin-like peptidase domain-containing protein n=1 Tax=Streptomyces longispororuber TaxID=68230 RepID=UPI0027E289D6|nr:trypsin-like peptidase domain-containing protein [Streptomyces longispororuber]